MALVVPNVSEVSMLDIMLGKSSAPIPTLRLFTSNVTPDNTTNLTNLTECTVAGYGLITIGPSSWTVGTDPTSHITSAGCPQQTFTLTTASSVYGYFVTDQASTPTTLLWCERFSGAPFTLPSGGGTIAITPKINLA